MTLTARPEFGHRTGIAREESLAHIAADLEGCGPDGRAEPGNDVSRFTIERRDCGLDDAGREPAPAGVRDADAIARAARKESPEGNPRRERRRRRPEKK